MSPVTQADGHDAPGLVDEAVPSMAAVIDQVVVGREHQVGQPVVAHELPDVLYRVQFRAFGWEREQGNVGRNLEALRQMPAGLVEDNDGMSARADFARDLGEMQVHGLGVAGRQDQGSSFAPLRADRPEDIGRGRALVMRG